MSKDRKIGGTARNAQHDAVAIPDENPTVAVAPTRLRDDFKAPPVEWVGGIGHFHAVIAGVNVGASTARVVEGGINIGCRLTTSAKNGC